MSDTTTAPAAPAAPAVTVADYAALVTASPLSVTDTVAAYRSLTPGDKTRARNALTSAVQSAVNGGDLATAQALLEIQKQQSVKITEAAVIDWTDNLARRAAALRCAADMIESGVASFRPAGVPDDAEIIWNDTDDATSVASLAAGYVEAFDYTDGDDDDDTVKIVKRLATAPIGGTRAASGDTKGHVMAALAAVPAGAWLTVAQIRSAVTDGFGYDDDRRPSSGGITAALERGLDGVETVADPLRARLV